jgi:hypothetical protein
MLDIYLVALVSVLLTEYGFQTRKRAMNQLTSSWRYLRTLARVGIWILALLWWFLRTRLFIPVLVMLFVGILSSEIAVLLIRRRTRKDVDGDYPLGRPSTHLLPFLFALLPAIFGGIFFQRWFPLSPTNLPIPPTLVLKLFTGFVMMFCWSTILTVSMVGLVRSNRFSDEIEPHLGGGEVIGILERLFTFILVIAGGLPAVGFAVAAKAAARYPQFKNPVFAEYFLIGTLCSIGISVLTGLAMGLP